MSRQIIATTGLLVAGLLSSSCAWAQAPTQLLWGDTHVHSNLSPDAFTFGNRGMLPEQAFRFARGETVVSQTGVKAKLAQPLDFLLV